MTEINIYKKLKDSRRAKNLTQQELSKLLRLPQGYISQVEAGKHDIKLSTLTDWARILGLEFMLLTKAQARDISYLIQATSVDNSEQTAPAYGPLPEVLNNE